MSRTTAHIINHTHWDREWFLTSIYTSRWIPGLIDKLEGLAVANSDFRFLFDGQTLVIEDLLTLRPDYAPRIERLIAQGNLTVGPYYCQPDWQLTGGELLIRNLLYGQRDLQRLGGEMRTGWLVDTFGHVSQAPQIHRLFDIDAVYVWRGVPRLEPYFTWQSPDGSNLLTIDLFGGYRNLYGITHVPEVAVTRLTAEVDKLQPFYPTPDIPMFDGYDLEDNPEDPIRFYTQETDVPSSVALVESTPARFAATVAAKELALPTIRGELNSGKYGATFPGTFSARTYLKLMARDCEWMLFQRCEPLAVLAAQKGRPYPTERFEGIGRQLLQNAVHDCICGVSIDQVHEKMEYSYRQAFAAMQEEVQSSLNVILADAAPGNYAVSTTPFPVDQWQAAGDQLLHVQCEGVGVWPVQEQIPVTAVNEPASGFEWRNAHYAATLQADGTLRIGESVLGRLLLFAEHGDTYSEEKGELIGRLEPTAAPVLVARSDQHALLQWTLAANSAATDAALEATAHLQLCLDASAVIKWEIELDSRGVDYRVEMEFATGLPGTIAAGMPFDVVQRPVADTDLLPRAITDEQAIAEFGSATLASVLLGQRELGAVTTFPMHDFVAINGPDKSGTPRTMAVLTKGIRSYSADANGVVTIHLRRAVEWLTKGNLRDRIGDAGPFFYVPDARCERVVRHEVAVAIGSFGPASMEMQAINAAYQNPPLAVHVDGPARASTGAATARPFLQEAAPLAALTCHGPQVLARFVNPTGHTQPLTHAYTRTNVWGEAVGEVTSLAPGEIVTVALEAGVQPASTHAGSAPGRPVVQLTPAAWRVGDNAGLPDPARLQELLEKIAELDAAQSALDASAPAASGQEPSSADQLRRQHREYIQQRERVEFQLSYLLNQRKLAAGGVLDYDYLYQPDSEITELGLALNHLRIKRRIFDYVVAALPV